MAEGVHPWHHATIVVLNKPGKPDYSIPKAYRPISLLECRGKLLEKIIAKCFQHDIENHQLMSMSQFGSCPQHNTCDVATTLIHHIQVTRQAGHISALLMFDISGFFNNLILERAVEVL